MPKKSSKRKQSVAPLPAPRKKEAGVGAQLAQLETIGLLVPAPTQPITSVPTEAQTYVFRHMLIRDAVYGTLLKTDRRQLHHQVGETLERLYPEPPSELLADLAHHFSAAGEEAKATDYLLRAGEHALRVAAHPEALALLGQAETLARRHAWRPQLQRSLEGQGRARALRGESETALGCLQEALELCTEPQQQARLCYEMGFIAVTHLHNHEPAEAYYQRGLAVLEGVPDSAVETARLFMGLGFLYNFQDEAGAARPLDYLQRALQLLEGSTHYRELAECYTQLAFIRAEFAPEETLHYAPRALQLCERFCFDQTAALAYSSLATAHRLRGQLAEAVAAYQASIACARRANDVMLEAYSHLDLGLAYLRRGEIAAARWEGEQALPIWEKIGNANMVSTVYALLIAAHEVANDPPNAAALLQRALQKVAEPGYMYYSLAGFLCVCQRHERALHFFRQVAPQLEDHIRAYARSDPNFRGLQDHPEFIQLTQA